MSIALLSCGQGHLPDTSTSTSAETPHLDDEKGPLRSDRSPLSNFVLVTSGESFSSSALDIPLFVEGDEPIVVDRIKLVSVAGLASPKVVSARIDASAAVGHIVNPVTDARNAPLLSFTVGANGRVSANRIVQVYYHLTSSGDSFTASFATQWVLCEKSEFTYAQCADALDVND
ncbi:MULTISPECIES: hypothetical protein [unclassified Nocardioides]|uniref:hypothetical protein n=1 Tax=unclassified Nocardioides TaxID=2615069 RepID=UPI0012E3DAE6|nr:MULTISPECIES: hypothetical protein [unclassified Nocardioides]